MEAERRITIGRWGEVKLRGVPTGYEAHRFPGDEWTVLTPTYSCVGCRSRDAVKRLIARWLRLKA